jgi:serine/threonine protein kinase
MYTPRGFKQYHVIEQAICVQAKLALEAAVTYYAAGEGVVPFYGYGSVFLPRAVAERMRGNEDDLCDLEDGDGDAGEMCQLPAMFLKRLHASLLDQLREDDPEDEGRHRRLIVDAPIVLKAYGQAFACLEHVHRLNIFHNDVDERNLLTDLPLGDPNSRVYLSDFGQALHASGRHRRLIKHGAYADPESVLSLQQGMCGAREADVYVLTLVTWSALCGVNFTMLENARQQMHLIAAQHATLKGNGFGVHDTEKDRMAYDLPYFPTLDGSESMCDLETTMQMAAAMHRRQRPSATACAAALLAAAQDPENSGLSFPGSKWVTEDDDMKAQFDAGMSVRLGHQNHWGHDDPVVLLHAEKLAEASAELQVCLCVLCCCHAYLAC